jgi:putative DNA methylase
LSAWEQAGLLPSEEIPPKSNYNRGHRLYGMTRWCDLFTPRQLLGHLTFVEGLNRVKPEILAQLGQDRGRAVVTYLQFAIDKALDYNSRQTLWHSSRGVIAHTFTRHDFSVKWTFAEMIFTGPNSGIAWALSQITSVYEQVAGYVKEITPLIQSGVLSPPTILYGTAAHMPNIGECSIDLICMDPPYYDNVQYGELSDYFCVWQRRTLTDLYPDLFTRRLVDKVDEAVANPARDGSVQAAKAMYERMMGEIFAECRRVLKDGALMTLMFTHRSQDAWETLTRALIEAGWIITSAFPVKSESSEDIHHKDMAATTSSIFLTVGSARQTVLSLPSGQALQVEASNNKFVIP